MGFPNRRMNKLDGWTLLTISGQNFLEYAGQENKKNRRKELLNSYSTLDEGQFQLIYETLMKCYSMNGTRIFTFVGVIRR